MKSEERAGCIGAVLFALLLPACFGGCYGCSKVQVADGFRDSTVRKVSESGVIWKTWEVEGLGDGFRLTDGKASPETFTYTVSDPAVLAKLRDLPPNKRVRVHYRKFLAAWQPNGETRYFVTGVENIE